MLQCAIVKVADRTHPAAFLLTGVLSAASLAGLVLVILTAPAVAGDEPIPIGRILADPEEYHLTSVAVTGTATDVQALEPYYTPTGSACYGAYTFRLTDGTGVLSVAVLGFCGTPVFRPPPIAEGDRVLVDAHIKAPGYDGYYRGLIGVPIPEQDLTTVRAIANLIRPAPARGPGADEPAGDGS